MIVVDTSALVAVLGAEPEALPFARCLEASPAVVISTGTAVELAIVARAKWGVGGVERLHRLLEELGIEYSPVDTSQMKAAIQGYATYGRGSGHPARLNYGDCFAYALAKTLDAPLLFKGDDFVHTDVRSAVEAR